MTKRKMKTLWMKEHDVNPKVPFITKLAVDESEGWACLHVVDRAKDRSRWCEFDRGKSINLTPAQARRLGEWLDAFAKEHGK